MPAPPNPYAASRTTGRGGTQIPSAVQQHAAYAVPLWDSDSPYTDEQGWAVRLRTSAQEIPSAARLGVLERFDYRPDPVYVRRFHARLDADDARRHSVEDQVAVGWKELKVSPGHPNPSTRRFAPNPREIPPPEPRPTTGMSPRTYSFTRPFDQFNRGSGIGLVGSARRLNGLHFSMADHRRNYPILGMAPPMSRRNTYRLEPPPWDTDIVDLPPETLIPSARIQSVEVPTAPRSYRLG